MNDQLREGAAQAPPPHGSGGDTGGTAGTMQGLAELVRRSAGITSHCLGEPLFESALRERLDATGETDPARYLARLPVEPDEMQALIELLVVPESWFFRDEAPFDALKQYAREWVARHPGAVLRVLSLPCSTGEEPYSIAIALHQAGLAPAQYHILAADISEVALARAHEAVYPPHSFRGTGPAFRAAYFEDLGGERYGLLPAFRERVSFRRLNLFEAEPAQLGEHDVIFCRNMLIYFDRATQRAALERLNAALAPGGLLFVGHAETMTVSFLGLPSYPYARCFAFINSSPAPEPATRTADRRARRIQARPDPARAPVRPRRPQPQPRSTAAPPPAPPPAADAPPDTPPDTLERACALADEGRLDEALAQAQQHQDAAGPCARSCFLLGLVHEARGEAEQADAWLRKAVYLDPHHDEALTLLGVLHERRGDLVEARRWRSRAARVRERRRDPPGTVTE